jgi:hypothetical protein
MCDEGVSGEGNHFVKKIGCEYISGKRNTYSCGYCDCKTDKISELLR